MTEFITRNYGRKDFEVIIKTDSEDDYLATQTFARRLIDHGKPVTNADRIRGMTDEELARHLSKMLADYTAGLYDWKYVPSEEVICGIKDELLRELQSPSDSPTGQKGCV